MQTLRSALMAAFLCCAALSHASAATITFDGLSGANLSPLPAYSEAGFNVGGVGSVFVGRVFGNPAPSLLGLASINGGNFGVTLTRLGGGTFTFEGLDVASNGGATGLRVQGRLAGSIVLSLAAEVFDTVTTFVTILSANATAVDTLLLSFTAGGSSANLDNIRVTPAATPVPVPEPASLALFLAGLAGLGAARRARRAA